MRQIGAAGCAGSLILLLMLLAACRHAPADQQVRDSIRSAAAAARANDARGVLDVVADDFVGHDGNFDRAALRRMLAARALRHDQTGVVVGPVALEHNGDRIIARFRLVLTGGQPNDLLPDSAEVYAMTTAWRENGGKWVCYSASWSGGGP